MSGPVPDPVKASGGRPDQVVADVLNGWVADPRPAVLVNQDQGLAAVAALRTAGFAVVKLPEQCIIPTGWGDDCLGSWPVMDYRDPVSAWPWGGAVDPGPGVADPDGDFMTVERARAYAAALLAAAGAAEAGQ